MIEQTYGETLEPGDEIGPLVIHPTTEVVRAFLSIWRRAPLAGDDRFTSQEGAARDGLAGPIVPGPMSHSFVTQFISDWAGAYGRLRSLEVNFRRPIQQGEDIKCLGLITDKHEEGEDTVVHIDLFIEDARGDRPLQGVAEVILPTKG